MVRSQLQTWSTVIRCFDRHSPTDTDTDTDANAADADTDADDVDDETALPPTRGPALAGGRCSGEVAL